MKKAREHAANGGGNPNSQAAASALDDASSLQNQNADGSGEVEDGAEDEQADTNSGANYNQRETDANTAATGGRDQVTGTAADASSGDAEKKAKPARREGVELPGGVVAPAWAVIVVGYFGALVCFVAVVRLLCRTPKKGKDGKGGKKSLTRVDSISETGSEAERVNNYNVRSELHAEERSNFLYGGDGDGDLSNRNNSSTSKSKQGGRSARASAKKSNSSRTPEKYKKRYDNAIARDDVSNLLIPNQPSRERVELEDGTRRFKDKKGFTRYDSGDGVEYDLTIAKETSAHYESRITIKKSISRMQSFNLSFTFNL